MTQLISNIITAQIPKDKSNSIEDIQDHLRKLEAARDEVVGVGLYDPTGDDLNVVDFIEREEKISKPQLEAFLISDKDDLRQKLLTHTAVQYAVMNIRGIQKNILIARAGRQLGLRGRMATFGGPSDRGMGPQEGLALVRDSDITSVPGVDALFIDPRKGALGRNLANNQAHYLACRWNYDLTPGSFLVATDVIVRNPLTGASFTARPVDWGPAAWTGRIADLSDRLALNLGLRTNDECEIIVPSPSSATNIVPRTETGSQVRDVLIQSASGQFARYGRVNEASEPLRGRIERYWNELRQGVPDDTFRFESVGVPWSAVFISWCVLQAGIPQSDFHYSPQHSQYVKHAIARATNAPAADNFVALRVTDYSPQPGDIIQHNRSGGNIKYDDAANNDGYPSHAVIVVSIGQNAHGPCATAVGGNESDTIRTHQIPLDGSGRIIQRQPNSYICVIKTA
jgi:Uncharacterized protein conserved in bacteria (DUF2272)